LRHLATLAALFVVAFAAPAEGSYRGAFYYQWFPELWTLGTHYNPAAGFYDSGDAAIIDRHLLELAYGKIDFGIASWWGRGRKSEQTRFPLLLRRTNALGLSRPLKWTLYYEQEGYSDPSVAELQSDLTYIRDRYVDDPAFFRIGGRPVLFVYNANETSCSVVSRWKQANAGFGFYLVMKVFAGWQGCPNQPNSWHQYGPSRREHSHLPYSYVISPGYWRVDEATPRLARDTVHSVPMFRQAIRNMIASSAQFQLITTHNEWGEGTSIEPAREWNCLTCRYGDYLKALHEDGAKLPL
jgi:hypothetical protein